MAMGMSAGTALFYKLKPLNVPLVGSLNRINRPRLVHQKSVTLHMRKMTVRATEEEETATEEPVVYNKEFGYSRKDVLIIGALMIGAGYGLYYGLQFFGIDELRAGSVSQLIVFVGVLLTWIVTYLFRVGSKKMTYVTQLEDYEEAVMRKRLEEMTDAEVEILMEEVEREKRQAAQNKSQNQINNMR